MTTYLLFDNAVRSPEMRHEISEPVADPVVFIEHDGRRIVAGPSLEAEVFAKREDVVDEFWSFADLGIDDLNADETIPADMIRPELVLRALRRLEAGEVVVPPTFYAQVADHLRASGIKVDIDSAIWAERRRRKTPAELEGTERAQRSAEIAMLTAARMLREAEPTENGMLRFEGEILTAEWVRESMTAMLSQQGTDSDEIIVQSGDACLKGHDLGSGPLLPERVLHHRRLPTRPPDRRVLGHDPHLRSRPSVRRTRETPPDMQGGSQDRTGRMPPGHRRPLSPCGGLVQLARSPEPTAPQRLPPRTHEQGFFHALGHGVGLEVHERPFLGRRCEALRPGDVIALEPACTTRASGE